MTSTSAVASIDDLDQLQPVLDIALDATVVMNSKGVIERWSSQASDIFGWSSAEAVGRLMADLIIPEQYRAAHTEGLKRFLETGEGPVFKRRFELSALRKGGEEFPIELSISPLRSSHGYVFVGFIRDITQRRRAEEVLRREAQEAALLHRVATLAATETTFEDIVRECLAAVCELTSWPLAHAFIPLVGGALVPTNIWHPGTNGFAGFVRATLETNFGPGVGLPGHVLQTREPLWIRDIQDNANFPRSVAAREAGLLSAFAFPLFIKHDIAVILEFFSNCSSPPNDHTRVVIHSLGEQVSRVLERRASNDVMLAEIELRRRAESHQKLLLHEMDHRVKNMLAVVMSISAQTGRNSGTLADYLESFNARLLSLSRGYHLLTEQKWTAAPLSDVITQSVDAHVTDKSQLLLNGPPAWLKPKAALGMSMIVHELATNALKYGALSTDDGRIEVEWTFSGPTTLHLRWQEFGVSGRERIEKEGFGSKLIRATACHDLGGTVEQTFAAGGIKYEFRVQCDDEPDSAC